MPRHLERAPRELCVARVPVVVRVAEARHARPRVVDEVEAGDGDVPRRRRRDRVLERLRRRGRRRRRRQDEGLRVPRDGRLGGPAGDKARKVASPSPLNSSMLAARVESRREQLLKRHRKKAAAEADWYAGKDAARTAG